MEYETELYAERLRREAQAAALASGQAQWTTGLDSAVRTKLSVAWTDALSDLPHEYAEKYAEAIQRRTLRSIAKTLVPANIRTSASTDDDVLSLIEAMHETAKKIASEAATLSPSSRAGTTYKAIIGAPQSFRDDVNRIFEAHIVAFHLHENSRLVPVQSHEMHGAVVGPTLYLLHSQPRFADAELAYQKALKELRNRDAGDAITDAATALQEVLTALGCKGSTLGELITSAKKKELLVGTDTPLVESIIKTVNWVAAQRNQGEAHRGNPEMNMSDAWMLVHVVGALAIRLSETVPPAEE